MYRTGFIAFLNHGFKVTLCMGAGPFSEEGGQERNRRGSDQFFYFAPSTFEFAHPGFIVLGGQKCNRCPPKSLNVKRDVCTIIFIVTIIYGTEKKFLNCWV